METPIRIGILIAGLFALWLLMSGVYKPLIIGFGVISSVLCVWIIKRLGLIDNRAAYEEMHVFGTLKYVFWLIVEIGKADWAVTKLIISSNVDVQQRLISVPVTQKSDLAKMLFANSITLTPGTVTVETETEQLIVHALTDEAANPDALEDMGSRVSALEKPVAGEPS